VGQVANLPLGARQVGNLPHVPRQARVIVSKEDELVLTVPTRIFHEAGLFQGLDPRADHYLPILLDPRHLSFLPRSRAETDPSYKQLIPYVVLRWAGQVYHYVRGQGGGEKRLRALRSVGVGGHINPIDGEAGANPYRQALLREVQEEIFLETTYEERCLGLINDDSTPVGQVHLGIVHVFDLAEPKARRREADLTQDGFAPLPELIQRKLEFETWSQFVLEHLG
jgi:predicted NUDIX family phosphoesterase